MSDTLGESQHRQVTEKVSAQRVCSGPHRILTYLFILSFISSLSTKYMTSTLLSPAETKVTNLS